MGQALKRQIQANFSDRDGGEGADLSIESDKPSLATEVSEISRNVGT